MKCKLLHFHTGKVCEIRTRRIMDGDIKMDKKNSYNIDKANPLLLSHPRGLTSMMSIMGLVLATIMGFMFPEFAGMFAGTFLGLAMMIWFMEKDKKLNIISPMYITKWNSAIPYTFARWRSGKETSEEEVPDNITLEFDRDILSKKLVETDGKKIALEVNLIDKKNKNQVPEKFLTSYTATFGEVNIENQPALSPENYKQLGTQGLVKQLLTLKKSEKFDVIMWMIIGGVMGFLAANFVGITGGLGGM